MTNKTQLPVEVVQEIKDAAKAYTNSEVKGMVDGADINPGHIKYAYEEGATEYATKLQDVKNRLFIEEQARDVLQRYFEMARPLLEDVFQKHESGLLPDRFIYEKIKRFLYGE